MGLWRRVKLAWRTYREFGKAEREYVERLQRKVMEEARNTRAEAKELAQQQQQFMTSFLKYWHSFLSSFTPRAKKPAPKQPLPDDRLAELAKRVDRLKQDAHQREIINHLQQGKPVTETVELLLTQAAKEHGMEKSAVWEALRRKLESSPGRTDSAPPRANGKEGQAK